MKYERIVKRFYDELENGIVLGRKCQDCGNVEYPPVLACRACSSPNMEWIELSGDAEVTELVAPSIMTTMPENEPYRPYMFGVVRLAEGSEVNAVITNVDPENMEELRTKLPMKVKMSIRQREGYKTVIFDAGENS